jgi:hypothetical protein
VLSEESILLWYNTHNTDTVDKEQLHRQVGDFITWLNEAEEESDDQSDDSDDSDED